MSVMSTISAAAQKFGPTAMMAGGIAGFIATVILACKATPAILDDIEEMNDAVDSAKEAGESIVTEYAKGAVKVIKHCAPAVAVGAASCALLIGSHGQMKNRMGLYAAAYNLLMEEHEEYRSIVRDEVGEERELLMHSRLEREIPDPEDPDGDMRPIYNPTGHGSAYAYWFGPNSTSKWSSNITYNRQLLYGAEKYFNQVLDSVGYVFLDDVLKYLGLQSCKMARMVGWRKEYVLRGDGQYHEESDGDGYISFGLTEWESYIKNHHSLPWEDNGREGWFLLNFNVDGIILDSIKFWH